MNNVNEPRGSNKSLKDIYSLLGPNLEASIFVEEWTDICKRLNPTPANIRRQNDCASRIDAFINEHRGVDYCKHLRESRIRKKLSKEVKTKPIQANRKKVMCVETQKVYNSIKEAARDVGCYGTHISKVCNGKQKTAAGYHWVRIGKEKADEK